MKLSVRYSNYNKKVKITEDNYLPVKAIDSYVSYGFLIDFTNQKLTINAYLKAQGS